MERLFDRICWRIAFWMPKRLVYYACIRAWSIATTGEYSFTIAPDLSAHEMTRRLQKEAFNVRRD